MSNGTIEFINKCESCIHSKDEYYVDGDLYSKAFNVDNCGCCIYSSSAEDNYENKDGSTGRHYRYR